MRDLTFTRSFPTCVIPAFTRTLPSPTANFRLRGSSENTWVFGAFVQGELLSWLSFFCLSSLCVLRLSFVFPFSLLPEGMCRFVWYGWHFRRLTYPNFEFFLCGLTSCIMHALLREVIGVFMYFLPLSSHFAMQCALVHCTRGVPASYTIFKAEISIVENRGNRPLFSNRLLIDEDDHYHDHDDEQLLRGL